jgi:hypothetical protein
MDRCGFGPTDDVEGDSLVGVAAQASNFEIAEAGIDRITD